MRPLVAPSDLSAEQRLDELAAILATGLLRMRKQSDALGDKRRSSGQFSPKCRLPGLELSVPSRLTVTPRW